MNSYRQLINVETENESSPGISYLIDYPIMKWLALNKYTDEKYQKDSACCSFIYIYMYK